MRVRNPAFSLFQEFRSLRVPLRVGTLGYYEGQEPGLFSLSRVSIFKGSFEGTLGYYEGQKPGLFSLSRVSIFKGSFEGTLGFLSFKSFDL